MHMLVGKFVAATFVIMIVYVLGAELIFSNMQKRSRVKRGQNVEEAVKLLS